MKQSFRTAAIQDTKRMEKAFRSFFFPFAIVFPLRLQYQKLLCGLCYHFASALAQDEHILDPHAEFARQIYARLGGYHSALRHRRFHRRRRRLFPTGKLPSGDAYPFQNVWRGRKVHDRIQERCIRIGQYIADTGATVRGAARHFGVSKSSVHKDVIK